MTKTIRWWSCSLILLVGLGAACGDSEEEPGEVENPNANEEPGVNQELPPPEPTYTYYQDVGPILDARCGSCHGDQAFGGLDFSTYEAVYATRPLIEIALKEGTMPPWLAADGCTEYQHSLQLEPGELDLLLTWLDEGAPTGDAGDPGAPLDAPSGGLERVDVELEMDGDYEPRLKPDDYRCFVIDWEGEEDQYITGFNVVPGNPEIVHHVIAFYAPPALADEALARQDAEEGMGYTCFGTPGLGEDVDFTGNESVGWLGSWAPGGTGVNFPEGTGISVAPGSKIIMQVHYNTYDGQDDTDRSAVQFKVDDQVEKPARYLPWANPAWPSNPSTMAIPAGDAEVAHSFGFDLVGFANRDITIYSANLHMHMLGTSGKLWVDRAAGDEQCLLEIPRWDFNWQSEYHLQEPVTLTDGDELWIGCEWDNSAGNQPVIQGSQIDPQDVGWGDGTTDEMCLGVFYVTFD